MKIKKHHNITFVTLVATFILTAAPSVSNTVSELVVIGRNGEVLSLIESDRQKKLTPVEIDVPHRFFLYDVSYAPSLGKVYVVESELKSYELDLFDLSKGYLRNGPTNDFAGLARYDSMEKRPAWLKLGDFDKGIKSVMQTIDENGHIKNSDPDNIHFSRWSAFESHFPTNGGFSSTSLAKTYKELAFLQSKHPDGEWLLYGRSARIASYTLIIANSTKDGELFKSVLLFQDQMRNKWIYAAFDEAIKGHVYDNIVVMRGEYNLKNDKDEIGNQIVGRPTGNWWFYSPDRPEIAKRKLNPPWVIHYATETTAYIVGDGKLMEIDIWESETPQAKVIAELPPDFIVVAVCPVPQREDTASKNEI